MSDMFRLKLKQLMSRVVQNTLKLILAVRKFTNAPNDFLPSVFFKIRPNSFGLRVWILDLCVLGYCRYIHFLEILRKSLRTLKRAVSVSVAAAMDPWELHQWFVLCLRGSASKSRKVKKTMSDRAWCHQHHIPCSWLWAWSTIRFDTETRQCGWLFGLWHW
jgi:hypothetical protein